MSDFLLYLLLAVFIMGAAVFFFAVAFGDTETFQAIDERIAKWIRGEGAEDEQP